MARTLKPKGETTMADVIVSNHGSVFTFTPLTDAGREWIDENVEKS
jgi:hypothetical protein